MKHLLYLIIMSLFANSTFSQNEVKLQEFTIINQEFYFVLDMLISDYSECENKEEGYYFTLSISEADIEKYSDVKIINISKSYYENYISDGYGFLSYKGYKFILQGQCIDIFNVANKTEEFPLKQEPTVIFDPPRWLIYYLNEQFYLADKSPCGG